MALQLGALRSALIDAGAKPEIAEAAAVEVAAHQKEFDSLQTKVGTGFSDNRAEFIKVRAEMTAGFAAAAIDRAEIRASIRILQWGQALIVAGIVSLMAKSFFRP